MGKYDCLLSKLLMAATVVATIVVIGCSATLDRTGSDAGPIASSAPDGAPQEGIKIHGRWMIEVTNRDGAVAERREFDNELLTYGPQTLSRILGRRNAVGGWQIGLLTNAVADSAFMDASSNPMFGEIRESSDQDVISGYRFKTLVIDVPTSGTNADKLVLSGTATANRNGKIERVGTSFIRKDNLTSDSGYGGGFMYAFTGTTLATPVNLTAGQMVAVTVVISFS